MEKCFKCQKEGDDLVFIPYDDVYCCNDCYSKYSYMCCTCNTISVIEDSMFQVGYKHICKKCRDYD